FWMRRFGGRPDAIGLTASFGERTFTIVGIMPPGFRFPTRTDLWYPAWVQPETTSRGAHNYRVVGRLKDDVALQQAQAEMAAVARQRAQGGRAGRAPLRERAYPATSAEKGVVLGPLQEQWGGDPRQTLTLRAGAGGLVLLIAFATAAILLWGGAAARRSELG